MLCINYRKLNNRKQIVHESKEGGNFSKVISDYLLPTIGSILAHFNGCKFFSTTELRSGYYHMRLARESAVKTAFVTDRGKWIILYPLVLILGFQLFLMC